MGVDQPEDADEQPDGHADHRDDQGDGRRAGRGGGSQAETRYRQECYVDLQVAVSAEQSVTAQQTAAREQAAAEKWGVKAQESRWMWAEYQRKWPSGEREQVDSSDDPPGSWRGDGNRILNPADNARVEAACDRIAKREEEEISPALRATESQDPDRHLVGFDDRLKGRDRIKEKVAKNIDEKNLSPEEATALLPDVIRYTFRYDEARYTHGVRTDIVRMKEQGFELKILKKSWSADQYRGINSQWIEPESGQRFELQFHTRISFEAKQITHSAYERLRTGQPDPLEHMVLEAFQRRVADAVPVPPGADGIPDYPERGADAR